ncbi:MAG: tRNA pseudouridine(55) synthase TruB [Pseudomonadota bacterium]
MARRRKGRRVDGWLVVDKPLGASSAAIVNKARWALEAQKAGHSGTLDPLASGCLAIAFGEATKVIPIAQEGAKRYRFTVRWGARTTTDDLEGEVIARSDLRPSDREIASILPGFLGEIDQVPPQFSAIKVDGARAYALARDGAEVALAARPIRVDRLEVIPPVTRDACDFEMICGKGGYVRSVARDLGEALGCHGHVSALRRLSTGPFDVAHAIGAAALEGLRGNGPPPQFLPLEAGLRDLPRLDCTAGAAEDLRQGRAIALTGGEGPVWVACQGRAVALGQMETGIFRPSRVFAPAETPE